ncbi:MAG: hypothetical protein NTV06_06520 [candidate division Zixibacteria bacterium]|nr:hypothetical protein [candidate division Zixibacteria bacterium]
MGNRRDKIRQNHKTSSGVLPYENGPRFRQEVRRGGLTALEIR